MRKNNTLLTSYISEQPHHYFPVSRHDIKAAAHIREKSLQLGADKFVKLTKVVNYFKSLPI